MAESTQTLTLADLKTAIGEYLGISRTVADWTAENVADIGRVLASAQRQFYSPSYRKVPNGPLQVHVWSFLRARASVVTSNGTASYDLPDDFAGFLVNRLSYTSTQPWSLKLTTMEDVLEHIQDFGTGLPTGVTAPQLAAVESKTSTLGTTGQRWSILMWPTPTSAFTLTGQYQINPNVLSTDAHYPLGGALHAETLLESCLAAAEEHLNDQLSIHRERFAELLNQSVQFDARLHAQEAA